MRSITTFFFALLLPLIITACATAQPPQPDPLREQLAILRKQLLELQVLQNDTRARLDEKTGIIETLTVKLNTLEERLQVLSRSPGNTKSGTATRNAQTNKNPIKKKQVRRQE